MFTPKLQWAGPRMAENSAVSGKQKSSGKDKIVAYVDVPPPPPTALLSDDGNLGNGENMEDWRRFQEAGLLDEATLQKRDREAMIQRIQRMEKELFDYQYHMGLLLIEKKEWSSKNEELQESLREADEILKREKSAHLMAIAEVEDREANLRKALEVERRCTIDLEKSLREFHSEHEKIKMASETKLADANNLLAGVQDRSLEVQQKLIQADGKLAEASKKSTEVERKLQEFETRESVLKRERMSFNSERDAHEAMFFKHKQDMQEWERKLQEAEERLCYNRRDINEREEKITELDRKLKERERELVDERKKYELENVALEKKEHEILQKLADLTVKEEQAESLRINLEMKEKDLTKWEERLITRERVELQVLVDEHRSAMELRKHEFELEMDEKRKLVEEEHNVKQGNLEKKHAEINHMEEKLMKREQAAENKLERVKEKEKDIELKLRGLKDRETALRLEAENLDRLRKEVASEKRNLQTLKDEVENVKAEIGQKELQVNDEIEKLKVTGEEREEHERLVGYLKQEIERYTQQKYLLSKESDDLKQDRKKFEEEWEALDGKRVELTKELQQLEAEKLLVEKLKSSTEKKLEEDRIATEDHIKRALESLRLDKESFEATMKHERTALLEKAQNEHDQLLHDFEKRRRDLEAEALNKQEEIERSLHEREMALEKDIEKEQSNLSRVKDVVQMETEDMKSARKRLEQDKENIAVGKQQLEQQQVEMRKDINELGALSQKIKVQRQEFIKERQKFVSLVETLKKCQSCGEMARNYILSELNLQELDDNLGDEILENVEGNVRKSLGENEPKSSGSGRLTSWILSKCTPRVLNLSRKGGHHDFPSKNLDQTLLHALDNASENVGEPTAPAGSVAQSDTPEGYRQVQQLRENPEDSDFAQHLRKSSRKQLRRTDKAVVREAEAFLKWNGEHNKDTSASIYEESKGDSLANNAARRTPRKRTLAQSSIMTGNDDAEPSESVTTGATTGGRRKRRQKVIPPAPVESTGKPRYNLRRNKIDGKAIAESMDDRNKTDGEIGDAALSLDHEISSVNRGNPSGTMKTTFYKSVQPKMVSTDNFQTSTSRIDEEVNGTPDNNEENEEESTLLGGEEEDEYEMGEASIPKKLWTFFTT